MFWLVRIIKKIFKKNIPLLTDNSNALIEKDNSFKIGLKQLADLEMNEGNGYKIIKNLRFKDMI